MFVHVLLLIRPTPILRVWPRKQPLMLYLGNQHTLLFIVFPMWSRQYIRCTSPHHLPVCVGCSAFVSLCRFDCISYQHLFKIPLGGGGGTNTNTTTNTRLLYGLGLGGISGGGTGNIAIGGGAKCHFRK